MRVCNGKAVPAVSHVFMTCVTHRLSID
jgi:hypothetical protein